jgi:hypothetical protein
MDMDPINGELLCAEYLTLKDGVVIPDREEDDDRNSGVKKRADIGFRGRRRAILVDCTTCSPLAKDVKDYKPGKTADAGTKRKMKEYERAYNIQRTGGDLSSTILRIYQTLAVEFQTARAEQIYITNRRYATNTPPLPPSSLLHPIPPPLPPPSLSLLDPRET